MKKFLLLVFLLFSLFAIFVTSCKSKPVALQPALPIDYSDTVTIEKGQENWFYEVKAPGRGKAHVELSNYGDSAKTFVVSIKEIGN